MYCEREKRGCCTGNIYTKVTADYWDYKWISRIINRQMFCIWQAMLKGYKHCATDIIVSSTVLLQHPAFLLSLKNKNAALCYLSLVDKTQQPE
ncbi:MAG: hypothetical protein JWR72_3222 [Flavisolibacter sp.]|nr:hypothetical protein [Flavisolibacter sp.]